jgi:hypothetical protein
MLLLDNGRLIFEHRFVMEEFLERKLSRSEVVHHKNHQRDDNRLDNLELMTRSEHAKFHHKDDVVRFANNCHHTNQKHYARGLCYRCYSNVRSDEWRRKNPDKIRKIKQKLYYKNIEKSREYVRNQARKRYAAEKQSSGSPVPVASDSKTEALD